ncbi:GNAT family N-acetyltransferase [Cellulomonas dongxiuzhuiae]|uniref:GNAT family N-acetyltransferase n=1 Tax=Cellulomonas dongxiuzhuiae TaxID=2819979 RepID=A0ABX8GJK7_9CELL|nr:GNAT family N-acetyltransferase [Cellulomonas dongxiuzhuiae]MBO3095388.1 GNAT family N-acetyltransferase [Cellulomonas dongxiuzhuiae]QWC16373.1 GNAT family N-acetyltransferase [Cellulomonas dongxiuzhuiae]
MPPTAVSVRVATVDDAERAGAVHFACWVETYSGLASREFWDRVSVERSVATWRRLLTDGLDATVAEVDGEVVGVAVAGDSGERGGHLPVRDRELSNLYVLQAHHGTGVGQALLDAVLPSGTSAQLWAARDNPRALRFYERNGFAPDGAADDGAAFGGIASVRLVR